MPHLSGTAIQQLMNQRGLDVKRFADVTNLSERTVRNAISGDNVRPQTHSAIAVGLNVSPASLLINTVQERPQAGHYRDVSGRWSGHGQDLTVPGHIEYKIDPVRYRFELDLNQSESTFSGTGWLIGQEEIRQPFEVRGVLKEEGNFVQMEWLNADPTIHDYGIGLLEHTADGKHLRGYFVGRERIHGESVIFGQIDASRVHSRRNGSSV